MISKTDNEMIGCLCLKFFQHASIIYLFTGTSSSFQLSPFSNPILASQPHGSATAGSMLITISCSELAATPDTAQLYEWYKPHLSRILPLPAQQLSQCGIILLGDRGTQQSAGVGPVVSVVASFPQQTENRTFCPVLQS